MKILVVGATGMLGKQVIRDLENGYTQIGALPKKLENVQVIACGSNQLDITNSNNCKEYFVEQKPDVCINCAAYTNVDGCETNQIDAFKVNAIGARNLAMACENVGAKLIHISTDYVFDGQASTPYCEYDVPSPNSVYGKTKLAGEMFVQQFCSKYFIVRTAWLYGVDGNNFVKTITKLAREKGELKVVDDQKGNPTNVADVSHHILQLAVTNEYGVYHCTGKGECSWYEFAKEIIRIAKIDAKITPCTTQEFPRPAKRPSYSCLENMMLSATVGNSMRDWKEALKAYFEKNI